MSAFQQKFKGKLTYMPKQGLLQMKDVHKSMEVMKIEDQEKTLKIPSKPLNSLQPSIRKNDIPKMIDNTKLKLQKGTESQKLKLPKIKDKRMDQTNYFFTKKAPLASPQKKIYSADHSKQLVYKQENEIEFLQQKHLQYLNRIEQLYMLKQK